MEKTAKLHGLLCLLFFGLVLYGCENNHDLPVYDPALDVYCLNIALVKDGTQDVSVGAYDKNGRKDNFSATSDNPSVATVRIVDTTIVVTATGMGSATINIKSSSGRSKKIPVKVYDLKVMETAELMISFSQTFSLRFADTKKKIASFWHPVTTDGFKPLGTLCIPGVENPDGKYGIMVVKAKDGSNALANPVDYTLVTDNSDTYWVTQCSIWIPVPPEGYKAMGIVVKDGFNKPGLTDVVCVRENLTIPGETAENCLKPLIGTSIVTNSFLLAWNILPPISGAHDNAFLTTGTFMALGVKISSENPVADPPSVHPVMNVLNIQLPMLAETPFQEYVPGLKSYDVPPEETVPIMAREMLVPCTIITDPLNNAEINKIANSPFYRLERQVYYKRVYHLYNKGSVVNTGTYSVKYGVTKAESDEFWNSTSISIASETGINIKDILSQKITITASKALGYSSQTSISELEEKSYETTVNVPPGKALAIWQRYNHFVLKRHNGKRIEPVKAWDIGIESFVIDEFPD